MANNTKLTGAEFFRKYSDIVNEAETDKLSKDEAAEKINQILMAAATQGGNGRLGESAEALNEGLMSKIMPLIAAASIGLGGAAASAPAAAYGGDEWRSQEHAVNQYNQPMQRECVNRARQVVDVMNRYGQVLASHPEIIKQCGPYVLTGQPIVIRDMGRGDERDVATALIGILGAAVIINQLDHNRGHNVQHAPQQQHRGGYRR